MSLYDEEEGNRPSRRESPSSLRLVTVEQKVDNLAAWHKARREDDDKDRVAVRTLMQDMLAQAKLTNGRVTRLETFKATVVGGGVAIAGMGGILGFLFKTLWDHGSK